jgi:hypothetical protein
MTSQLTMDEAEPGMRGQALTFQSGPSSSLRWRTGETNMFPCCLRAYEGSEARTTQSEGHDHVLTRWVSSRSGRLRRFSHRILKVTQGDPGKVMRASQNSDPPGSTHPSPNMYVCVCIQENFFWAVFTFVSGNW